MHVLELFLFEIKFSSPRSIDYYTKLLNVEKFPSSLLAAIYEGSGTIKWGVIAGNISCSTRMLLPGLTLLSSALSGVKYSISALLKKKKKRYQNLWLSPKWKPSLSLFKKYLKNKNKPPVLSSGMRGSALCNIHLGRLLCLSHTPRSMSSTMLSGDNNSWRWIQTKNLRFVEAEHDGGVVLRLVIKGWNLQFTVKCLKPSLVHSSLCFSSEALNEVVFF